MNEKSKIIRRNRKEFTLKYYYQPKQSYPFDYDAVCLKIIESSELGYRTIPLKYFNNIETLKSIIISMLPKDPEDTFDLEVKKWDGNL